MSVSQRGASRGGLLLKDPIHRGVLRLVLSQESKNLGHVLLTEPGEDHAAVCFLGDVVGIIEKSVGDEFSLR